MSNIYISTTGLTSSVVLNDLGARTFTHPTTNYNIGLEYRYTELLGSNDFNSALDFGFLTASYNGFSFTASTALQPVTNAGINLTTLPDFIITSNKLGTAIVTSAKLASANLQALFNYNSNGFITMTGTASFSSRTITGVTGSIVVTNGDGVSGNPVLNLALVGTASTYGSTTQYAKITTDVFGRVASVALQDVLVNSTETTTATAQSTTSTGFIAMSGLDQTPAAGTYVAILSCEGSCAVAGVDNGIEVGIFVGGTAITNSIRDSRTTATGLSLASLGSSNAIFTACKITVNGTQVVQGGFRRSGGSTVTVNERSLILIKSN